MEWEYIIIYLLQQKYWFQKYLKRRIIWMGIRIHWTLLLTHLHDYKREIRMMPIGNFIHNSIRRWIYQLNYIWIVLLIWKISLSPFLYLVTKGVMERRRSNVFVYNPMSSKQKHVQIPSQLKCKRNILLSPKMVSSISIFKNMLYITIRIKCNLLVNTP